MNQNINNQQVSDDFLEWIDKVIKFSKEDIFVGGVCGDLQIKLMEQIRDKYVSLLSIGVEPINFEDDIDTIGNCANCGVEFHIHKENTKNKPIKNEELKTANEFLYESGIDTMSMQDDFNCQLFYAMERYAEQYAASKLNNTIEDKWISVENKLPEPGYEYLCYDDENDNCDVWYYDEDGFGYLGDTKKSVTHWQYLPKAPNQ